MWWLVLLLVGVPDLARVAAHVWFVHVRHVLDHAFPDELPWTAGEWLAGKLEALGLRGQISVVVTNEVAHSKDAFHVRRGVIQLTDHTSFKRDPVYLAIAAHELGHARFRLRHPLSTTAGRAGALAKALLIKLGIGLAAGNVLVAIPLATTIAFWCLVAATVLHVFELADELIASFDAWRLLRAEPAVTRPHLRAVRSTLTAAFLTYLAPFAAYTVLLSQWWLVERLTAVPRVPGGGVTTLGLVGAAVASGYAILYSLNFVLAAARAPRILRLKPTVLALGYVVSIAAMIALGWDRHPGASYGWCVLLACCEIDRLVVALIELPAMIGTLPLMRWASRQDRGIEMSTVFRTARAAGLVETAYGNRRIASMAAEDAGRVSVILRLWQLNHLLVLPMILRFWM